MLTMFIKAYCINILANVRPIYLKKHVFSRVTLQVVFGIHLGSGIPILGTSNLGAQIR